MGRWFSQMQQEKYEKNVLFAQIFIDKEKDL
jgi:hypothetical protein